MKDKDEIVDGPLNTDNPEFITEPRLLFGRGEQRAHLVQRLKWKIKDIWGAISYIPSFIVRVLQYSKRLWGDVDWDYSSLLRLTQYKLARMREYHKNHGHTVAAPLMVKQMAYAELLINRILEDDYAKEEQATIKEKYGEVIGYMYSPKDPGYPGSMVVMTRENCRTPEEIEEERAAQHILFDKQTAAKEKDYDRLFRHIRRYIERWWD